jgi:hypothetical protein
MMYGVGDLRANSALPHNQPLPQDGAVEPPERDVRQLGKHGDRGEGRLLACDATGEV